MESTPRALRAANESTPRAPRAGDMVIVLAKMNSGKVTEMSGYVEDVSADYVYFALDTICLGPDPQEDDHPPLEVKTWPKTAIHLLRVGVPLDDLKPFGRMLDDNVPCWLVRV
jgi:hypothetical protein